MAVVTLRLDDETRDELEQVAQGRGLTLSALLRSAVDELLGRDVERPRADTPRTLSLLNRQMLALQHEILAAVSTEEYLREYHQKRMVVLQDGWTGEYHSEFLAISPELPAADCTMVMDLLDMFTVFQVALKKLDGQAKADLGDQARWLEFAGLDSNDAVESRLASYAEFLIKRGKWESLAHHFDDEHEGGNSHMRLLGRYRRLLAAYKTVMKKRQAESGPTMAAFELDAAALRTILEAADAR